MKYIIVLLLSICIGCSSPSEKYRGEKPFPIGSQVKYKTGDKIYTVIEYGNYVGDNKMRLTYGEGYIAFIDENDYFLLERVKK